MLEDRKKQKKLDAILMLSTLSPGGKMQWLDQPRYLAPEEISNPFVEKSDFANHIKKIQSIDRKRDGIQEMYKKQVTQAQYEEL